MHVHVPDAGQWTVGILPQCGLQAVVNGSADREKHLVSADGIINTRKRCRCAGKTAANRVAGIKPVSGKVGDTGRRVACQIATDCRDGSGGGDSAPATRTSHCSVNRG